MSEAEIKNEIKHIQNNCTACTDRVCSAIAKLEGKIDLLFEQNHKQDLEIQKIKNDKSGRIALVTAISGAFLSVATVLFGIILWVMRFS